MFSSTHKKKDLLKCGKLTTTLLCLVTEFASQCSALVEKNLKSSKTSWQLIHISLNTWYNLVYHVYEYVACCSHCVFISYFFFTSRSNYPFNSFKRSPVVLVYVMVISLNFLLWKVTIAYSFNIRLRWCCFDFFYAWNLDNNFFSFG